MRLTFLDQAGIEYSATCSAFSKFYANHRTKTYLKKSRHSRRTVTSLHSDQLKNKYMLKLSHLLTVWSVNFWSPLISWKAMRSNTLRGCKIWLSLFSSCTDSLKKWLLSLILKKRQLKFRSKCSRTCTLWTKSSYRKLKPLLQIYRSFSWLIKLCWSNMLDRSSNLTK